MHTYRITDNTQQTDCKPEHRKWNLTIIDQDAPRPGLTLEYHSFDTKQEAEEFVMVRKLCRGDF